MSVPLDAERAASIASQSDCPTAPSSTGWRDSRDYPRNGKPFEVWGRHYRWPEVVMWAAYDADAAAETVEDGYWRYAEDILADNTDNAAPEEWLWWRPITPPAENDAAVRPFTGSAQSQHLEDHVVLPPTGDRQALADRLEAMIPPVHVGFKSAEDINTLRQAAAHLRAQEARIGELENVRSYAAQLAKMCPADIGFNNCLQHLGDMAEALTQRSPRP